MEFMDVIHARRTVRSFTDEPVPREVLEGLLQAAVQAPTGMNLQPWAFGIILGVERLRELSTRTKAYLLEHLEQFPMFARYRDMLANPESTVCYGAPACIVVFAKPNGATPENDCTMAAHNIMLAACNQGLGSCWVGFLGLLLNEAEVKREFGVPEDYRVVAPIIIGHPQGNIPPVPKNAPEILFWQS